MSCKHCETLRQALSPLEDRVFTHKYLAAQPVDYLDTQRDSGHVRMTLGMLWDRTWPDTRPNSLELTKLGRTLDALGWRRTKYNGLLYFVIPTTLTTEI